MLLRLVALGLGIGLLTEVAHAQPALERVEKLLRDQLQSGPARTPEPGYLGLIGDDTNENGRGVRVLEVFAGGPAARSGLQNGDLIVQIDGRIIRVMDDMAQALEGKLESAKLVFTVTRAGANRAVAVTLGRRPTGRPANGKSEELPEPKPAAKPAAPAPATSPPAPTKPQPASAPVPPPPAPGPSPDAAPGSPAPRARLGLRSVPVTAEVQTRNKLPAASGAHVVAVIDDSPAQRAGIPIGAVITAVGDSPVRTPDELAAAIRGAPNRVELTYVVSGQTSRSEVSFDPPGDAPALQLRAKPPVEPPPAVPPQPDSGPELPATEPPLLTPIEQRLKALEDRLQKLEERLQAVEKPAAKTDS